MEPTRPSSEAGAIAQGGLDPAAPSLAPAQLLEVLARLVLLVREAVATPGEGAEAPPLTITQFRLLWRLACRTWLTSELAAELDVTAATVSATIDCLVRRALVERLPPSGDRRNVPLQATAAGRTALEAARRRQQEAMANLLSALSAAERQGLALGLAGLARALGTGTAPGVQPAASAPAMQAPTG